jgi:hypothetical protein
MVAGGPYMKIWALRKNLPKNVFEEPTVRQIISQDPRRFMFNFYLWRQELEQAGRKIDTDDFGFHVIDINDYTANWEGTYYGSFYGPTAMLDEFEAWERKYQERFPTSGKELLPTLPESYILSGTNIAHSGIANDSAFGTLDVNNLILAKWQWIMQNCNGRVWVTNRSFIFEDDSDAVLYKLTEQK